MKKLFALALALCLLFACATAHAEKEFKWTDVESAAAAYPGDFLAIEETGMVFYVPETFEEADLTEEEEEAGMLLLLSNGTNEVGVYTVSLEGKSVEDYLKEINAQDPENIVVNGFDAVNYDETEDDGGKSSSVLYELEGGKEAVIFTYTHMENEAFQPVAAIMMASVQEEE